MPGVYEMQVKQKPKFKLTAIRKGMLGGSTFEKVRSSPDKGPLSANSTSFAELSD